MKVRFIGSLRSLASRDGIVLEFADLMSLEDVVRTIVKKLPVLKTVFSNLRSESPKANMLVFVNGKEVSVLSGWKTAIGDGDEVVIVPVLHGG